MRRSVEEYSLHRQQAARLSRDVSENGDHTDYLCFLLVFVAATWWQGVPLAILLGLLMAGIGFNIEHDGGHQAHFEFAVRWLRRLGAPNPVVVSRT